MPLFDITTALSCELAAANQLAERLSETTGMQNLAEAASAAEAASKIIVGIAGDPFEGEGYTLPELENRHFVARIYAESEEGFAASLSPEAWGTPREGGAFRVYVRRQVRESEDKRDAYNFFWDRVSAIGPDVILKSEQHLLEPRNYRFTQVSRAIGPDFGERRTEGEQGIYLVALLTFTWGDVEQE